MMAKGPQHEVTAQQEEEIGERQQEPGPFTVADLDQPFERAVLEHAIVDLGHGWRVRPVSGSSHVSFR
jgi:hypothetical protein